MHAVVDELLELRGGSAEAARRPDQASRLWREGKLSDKPVTVFTSAYNRHVGNEATILSLASAFYHWGALIVPMGYTDPSVYAAGGNPYGTSFVPAPGAEHHGTVVLDAARHQGRRLAEMTLRLTGLQPSHDSVRRDVTYDDIDSTALESASQSR